MLDVKIATVAVERLWSALVSDADLVMRRANVNVMLSSPV